MIANCDNFIQTKFISLNSFCIKSYVDTHKLAILIKYSFICEYTQDVLSHFDLWLIGL